MRLIDANELLRTFIVNSDGRRIPEKDCDNFDITISLKEIKRIIRECPTVYDFNKVVERLQKEMKKAKEDVENGRGLLIKEPYTPYIKAIQIVKEGIYEK